MRLRYLSPLLLALSLFCNPSFAQQTLGSLVGAVADSSDAVVANADVTLTNEQTGLTQS